MNSERDHARRAREVSQRRLARDRTHWPEIRHMVEFWHRVRTENHLAEEIIASMRHRFGDERDEEAGE